MGYVDDYKALRHASGWYVRGEGIVAISGDGAKALLGAYLAKSTAYGLSGTAIESIVLDDEGTVVDVAVAIFEDDRLLLVSERTADAVVEDLTRVIEHNALDAEAFSLGSSSAAVAVEGPTSWSVAAELTGEDLSTLGLGEVRDITIDGAGAYVIRTGTTAEYGYLIVAPAMGAELVEAAVGAGASRVGRDALERARAETNYPLLASQCAGIPAPEAGATWLASPERDDVFRGKESLLAALERPSRSTVALRARSGTGFEVGASVFADGHPIGTVTAVFAPLPDQEDIALALLDKPFDVPGLELAVGADGVRTVSRPAVEPDSWSRVIG